jgi:hypothetical protein
MSSEQIEREYQTAKKELLEAEEKFNELASRLPIWLERIAKRRRSLLERISNDDPTLTKRELGKGLHLAEIESGVYSALHDQEEKCGELRLRWAALLRQRLGHP